MSFNEDNVLTYIAAEWDTSNATIPTLFTKNQMLLDYSNSVFVKRHKLPSAWVASNVKRTMEFYEFQLKCSTKDDVDELVRILHLYPETQAKEWGFDESTEALSFAGWTRGPSPNGPTWSTTYAHGGTHSGKPVTSTGQSYCWRHDFDDPNIYKASVWLKVHAVGADNGTVWIFCLQSGTPEYVAGQFWLAADRYIYYNYIKGGAAAHNSGVQFTVDTWFKLGFVLNHATQIVDYYINDAYIASHEYYANPTHVDVDGFCVEHYGYDNGWEWYFDDVSITGEDNYDYLPEKPQIDVEYLGQDIKGQHVWKANMYVVKYE